jgi:hypothetical protein
MKTAYQERMRHLLDMYAQREPEPTPLLPYAGPLSPEPVERQPYDELYVKLKAQRDAWSRN